MLARLKGSRSDVDLRGGHNAPGDSIDRDKTRTLLMVQVNGE